MQTPIILQANFLTATVQRLIYSMCSVLPPENLLEDINWKLLPTVQTRRQRTPKNRNIYLYLCKLPHISGDLLVVSHPSHSLEVTQEQFVKLFSHVIPSKSYNLPQQWSSALMGEYIQVLRFAVGPGHSWNACSRSTLSLGLGEIGQ